jgi:hypothetical protein
MSPSQFSAELRRMATGIDRAKKPAPQLVAQDLRRLLASLEETPAAPSAEAPPEAPPVDLSPEQAAEAIQGIASKLAASKNPNPELVISDLKRVIALL